MCQEYVDVVLSSKTTGSDTLRRRLHNEISIMVIGKSRDGLDQQKADEIADFASFLTMGMSLKEAFADLNKYQGVA